MIMPAADVSVDDSYSFQSTPRLINRKCLFYLVCVDDNILLSSQTPVVYDFL